MRRIAIIAGGFHQFVHYIRAEGLDGLKCIYIRDTQDLRGLHDVEVRFVGEYWLNPAYNEAKMTKEILSYVPEPKRTTRVILAKIRLFLKGVFQKCFQKT